MGNGTTYLFNVEFVFASLVSAAVILTVIVRWISGRTGNIEKLDSQDIKDNN
jgi:HAMP domain-containing protein